MLAGQIGYAQSARKAKVKGPRATGLLELAPNGKAHLIPITIMVDGKFYDASAYKADPVPFALESEVVYEAMRTGVPLGEFTVTGALQAQDAWFGEGNWVPEGSRTKKKKVADNKPNLDDDSGPPTLRKAGGSKSSGAPASDTSPSPKPPASTGPNTSSPSSSGTSPSPSSSVDKSHSEDDRSGQTNSVSSNPDSSESANDEDPNRPSLRRGKPAPSSSSATASKAASTKPSAGRAGTDVTAGNPSTKPAAGKPSDASPPGVSIQLIPAVSDAGGPEPRPYTFIMKADEEQSYRKKLLVLASAEVAAKAKEMTPVLPSAAPPKRTTATKPAAKTPQPVFDKIQIHSFDLWNTNEPVFVMTAQARMPASAAPKAPLSDSTYFITLVAKADIYLDLHKLLSEVTDDKHLDEFLRFELIDAVDADGDGRGELLFREVSDSGTAYAVYRAAADQLYPLFEGTPQQSHPLPVSAR